MMAINSCIQALVNFCFRLLLVALPLCLCGCATPYRPLKGGKGFSESQITTNEFSVSFQGNGRTSLEQDYDLVLLRAAEVTLEHSFSNFAVMDVTNTSSARPYTVRQRFYGNNTAEASLVPPTPGGYNLSSGYIYEVKERRIDFQPGTILRIKCFPTKPDKPFTYDAAELRDSLKRKYKLR
jgi:hypothetical protein